MALCYEEARVQGFNSPWVHEGQIYGKSLRVKFSLNPWRSNPNNDQSSRVQFSESMKVKSKKWAWGPSSGSLEVLPWNKWLLVSPRTLVTMAPAGLTEVTYGLRSAIYTFDLKLTCILAANLQNRSFKLTCIFAANLQKRSFNFLFVKFCWPTNHFISLLFFWQS